MIYRLAKMLYNGGFTNSKRIMQRIPGLYIAASELAGRGVFTAQAVPEGALVEVAPVIVIPKTQVGSIHATVLHDFYFRWNRDLDDAAIALGYGSLYNHSFEPNLRFELDFGNQTIDFYAARPISAGEELTINYNGDAWNKTPLWFHETDNSKRTV